ncbi:hypothetical protein [Asticcacaulis sp.]|jgi:plastocyanin|uniref:hypothetical protein n=1 Tax=Asticcacaulis sp. TaxID=1872648 RepID=UPI0031D309AA
MKTTLTVIGSLLCATPVVAADLRVSITDTSGKPVRDAVVTYEPAAGSAPVGIKAPYVMAQRDMNFTPYVLVVPAGATVSFPNQDAVSHHVYSFSPARKFQLPLYGGGLSRSLTFPTAGTVAIGCNIHDSMQAYIRVIDTAIYAQTDDKGVVTLTNLPNGAGDLVIWHPMSSAKGGETHLPLSVQGPIKPISVQLKIRRMAHAGGGY